MSEVNKELDQSGISLNDFLISPVQEVKDLAERAVRIQSMYENSQITEDEYKELANDLLELKEINEEMVGLEVIRELWLLVNLLKNIKFFASL